MMRRFDSRAPGFAAVLDSLLAAPGDTDGELMQTVTAIIDAVRKRGDEALVEYTNRFDNRSISAVDLELDKEDVDKSAATVPREVLTALRSAAERIETFHRHQVASSWEFVDASGVRLGQKITPIDRVGIYVPGGRAAYPSSVLMNAIPARVAGVGEILMTVPAPNGALSPAVLAAARIAGVDRIFTVGGAQAIAALAYGTATIPAVDKIVGPGNRYVALAKRLVYGQVGIDMIAGPSEVVILTDGSADPDWVAMDMFAQAEHDEDARAFLICDLPGFLDQVAASISRLLPDMERAEIIGRSLRKNGALIGVKDLKEAAAIVNLIAPEHLELYVTAPETALQDIRHAGAVFLGSHAAEVLGDYCAGPNHVLPTARTARFSSALGVYDFQKRISILECSPESGADLGAIASVLARAEGLTAHARAAEMRTGKYRSSS